MLHIHKPEFVVCDAPSKMANWKDVREVNKIVDQVCDVQRKAGRRFVLVQCLGAPRHLCEVFRDLRNKCDSRQFVAHLESKRVTTNSSAISEAILDKCGVSKNLEDKIQKGFEVHLLEGKRQQRDLLSLSTSESLHKDEHQGVYVDDITGGILDSKLTLQARALEMKTFEEMEVYEYVSTEVARKDTEGKIVGVRWVDVLKGEGVRSRLVAQEFAGDDDRDDIFAATPPLFATKACISQAASQGANGPGEVALMVLDVKRAFLYGDIEDSVYIRLPP